MYAQVWRTAAGHHPADGAALTGVMTLAHRRAVDRVRAEAAAGRREWAYGTRQVETPADIVAETAVLQVWLMKDRPGRRGPGAP